MPLPFHAPRNRKRRSILLTPACRAKHGLVPDDLKKLALAEKVLADAGDVLAEVTRNIGSKMWDAESWAEWSNGRFVKWLRIFECTALQQGCGADKGALMLPRRRGRGGARVAPLGRTP